MAISVQRSMGARDAWKLGLGSHAEAWLLGGDAGDAGASFSGSAAAFMMSVFVGVVSGASAAVTGVTGAGGAGMGVAGGGTGRGGLYSAITGRSGAPPLWASALLTGTAAPGNGWTIATPPCTCRPGGTSPAGAG